MTVADLIRIVEDGRYVNHLIFLDDKIFCLFEGPPMVAILHGNVVAEPYYVVPVAPAVDECNPGIACGTLEQAMAAYMRMIAERSEND